MRLLWILGVLFSAFLGGGVAQLISSRASSALTSILTTTQLWTQDGTSQFQFNSWPAQYWELSQGTASMPNRSAGPLFKISRTESVDRATCKGNNVDNECNAALAVYSFGSA